MVLIFQQFFFILLTMEYHVLIFYPIDRNLFPKLSLSLFFPLHPTIE